MKRLGIHRSWLPAILAGLAAGWLALSVRPADAGEPTAAWRVAMTDFTTDDGLIASAEGAAQWSLLTQAALAGEENVQWIERAQLQLAAEELHLSAGGFTSAAGSLRAGRWLKADVAILGRFIRNEHDDDGHTLRLEIVDLDHADTLAVRTIPVPGDRRETISPEDSLVKTTVSALHDALAEARATLSHRTGRRTVAPLFVRNADPSPRLDGLGPELIDALAHGADRSADVCVLRFPQADHTRDEAELVVGGFTDADGPRRVADLYIWGSYQETPAAGAAFAQTPVEIDLTCWDGVRPPTHLTEHTTVAELPALIRRLSDRCLDAARQVPADRAPSSNAVGRPVAGLLREQGEQLATVLDGYGPQRSVFLNTPAGKKTDAQARLLLETACFFAPNDSVAQAARLRLRWGGFPVPAPGLPLLDAWRCADEVVTVAESCEAAGDAATDFRRARLDLDAYLLERLGRGETELHQPHSEPNLPIDVPDATLTAWHATLDERFARDAEAFAKSAATPSAHAAGVWDHTVWLRAVFQRVHDPARGMRVLEAIWPTYGPLYRRNPAEANDYFRGEASLSVEVRKLALRQKQSERGEVLLASLSVGNTSARTTAAAPAATPGTLPVLTAIVRTPRYAPPEPPRPAPTANATRVFLMPHDPASGVDITVVPRYSVRSLALDGDGALWMSILREKGIGEQLAPTEENQDLVRFEPSGGTFRPVPVPGLTARPPVAVAFPAGGSVWLAQDYTGLRRYDPAAANVTRRYTVADGLATSNVDSMATDGEGRTFLIGREQRLALVQEYDPARQEWLRVGPPPGDPPPLPAADDPDSYMPPVSQVAACGHWLLTGLGARWTLFDHASGRTLELRPLLEKLPTPAADVAAEQHAHGRFHAGWWLSRAPRLCAADAGGFWLVDAARIVRFDPAHPGAMRSWPLPTEMGLGVTALASDGENLWLVGPSAKARSLKQPPTVLAVQLPPMPGVPYFGPGIDGWGFVAVLHAADGQWRGGFEVPERVGCLAVSQKTLYLGLTTAAQPLIEIDKTSIRAEGQVH